MATSFKQSLLLEVSKRAVHSKVRDVLNAILKKEIYKAYKMPLVVGFSDKLNLTNRLSLHLISRARATWSQKTSTRTALISNYHSLNK